MNLRELNSLARTKAGAGAAALLRSEEITLALLEEITTRQMQVLSAGKPLRQTVVNFTPSAKSGPVDPSILTGKSRQPDFVRVKLPNAEEFSLLTIADDIQGLTDAEARGKLAILFYGDPLQYQLTWTPDGEVLEFWIDSDVSTLVQVAQGGTKLPAKFDFMIAAGAAIKVMPATVLRDPSRQVYAQLQMQALGAELVRYEADWAQFLFQSSSVGTPTQIIRFKSGPARRFRRFPY